MISRFFKKKPKLEKSPLASKKKPNQAPGKGKRVEKERDGDKHIESPSLTLVKIPPLPPGKIITAEGWKRLMKQNTPRKK